MTSRSTAGFFENKNHLYETILLTDHYTIEDFLKKIYTVLCWCVHIRYVLSMVRGLNAWDLLPPQWSLAYLYVQP